MFVNGFQLRMTLDPYSHVPVWHVRFIGKYTHMDHLAALEPQKKGEHA